MFDFVAHADQAATEYDAIRTKYSLLAEQVHRIITNSFEALRGINLHKIEYRSKDKESFRKKCLKSGEKNEPKYKSPLLEITDLAGVRVILFFPDDVRKMCEFVEKNFDIKEKTDVGEARFAASGSFGYQSIHYLVRIGPDRLKMPDFAHFKDLVCEIQVRTILQHAWAEMEHDIQYKSPENLPSELRRKFIALAGMLEIADREFQSIQIEDARLRSLMKESEVGQLTREVISSKQGDHSSQESIDDQDNAVKARDLVISGEFSRAVEVYSRQIARQPRSHTLYLGRARAFFLSGDRAAALKDIHQAEELNPDDPAIAGTKIQIDSGDVPKPASNSESAKEAVRIGNAALASGDGEKAYVYFSEAQTAGHSHIFSMFNMAMACALVGDTVGARRFLAGFRPIPGSPIEINLEALRRIIDCVDDSDVQDLTNLRNLLDEMEDFSYAISPLRNLYSGFQSRGDVPKGADEIISILKKDGAVMLTHPSSTPR